MGNPLGLASTSLLLITAYTLAGEATVVRFDTTDGVHLVADYYPAPNGKAAPIVILLHGYRFDRSVWRSFAPILNQSGFAVLALDLRGFGQSVEPASMNLVERMKSRDSGHFNNMHGDLEAAYAWLSERPQEVDLARIGLIGSSVGCSVALHYASQDPSIDAVVCLTPGENYMGMDSRTHIKPVRGRMLLLCTEEERQASEALAPLNERATVRVVVPGKLHGTAMLGHVPGIEKQIVDFLSAAFGSLSSHPVIAAFGGDQAFNVGSEEALRIAKPLRRWYSSAEEAKDRGLIAPEDHHEGVLNDAVLTRPLPERRR